MTWFRPEMVLEFSMDIMALHRILLALLLSLTMAFSPTVSVAMMKPCTMTGERMTGEKMTGGKMSVGNPSVCPCHAIPGCGSMPQCRTAIGCANYCFFGSAFLPNVAGPFLIARPAAPIQYNGDLESGLLRPPTHVRCFWPGADRRARGLAS
jgi:hypothetical protein